MNYKKLFSSFVFSFVLIISFFSIAGVVKADTWPLVGWGWSSTLGHISFSCNNNAECPQSTYGVNLDSYNGELSGYAWSSTVGWIQFQGDATHPAPTVTDWGTGKMVGWARACVGTVNGLCTGPARTDGWDGWIKLSDSELGVASRFTSPMLDGSRGITFKAGGTFAGYAWGDVNMGWMTFGNVRSSTNTQLPTVTLTANPLTVESGGSTILTWKPENANACTASTTNDTWTGVKSFSNGTYTETRTGLTGTFPKTYSITCSNQFGSDTATVKVSLTSPSVSPSSPPGGGSQTLTLSPGCSPVRVDLGWGAVTGATGYTISRSLTPSGNYTTFASVGSNITTYPDTGLAPSTIYYYRVIAGGTSKIYSGSTATGACQSGSSDTDLKMWISDAVSGGQDSKNVDYKTIKLGQEFTIRWDEVNTSTIINFGDCDLLEKYNNGEFLNAEGVNSEKVYTNRPNLVGTYYYKLSCKGKGQSPALYSARVYIDNITPKTKADGVSFIYELTVVVKSSKINEQ